MKLTELHSDNRGQIFLLTEDLQHPEFTIFTTKAGLARGGCIHNKSTEYVCVIAGEIEYTLPDKTIYMTTGDTLTIPPATQHYFISRTDSVVAEWGATSEEKKEKYPQYRAIVEKINNNA